MEERRHYAVRELYDQNVFVKHGIHQAREYQMSHMHFHDGVELFLALSDHTVFIMEEEAYCLNRGCLIMVNNTEMHRTVAPPDGTYERYIVSFLPEYLRCLGLDEQITETLFGYPRRQVRSIQLSEDQLGELLVAIRQLEGYISREGYGQEYLKRFALGQILVLCSGYFAYGMGAPLLPDMPKRLLPAFAYIRAHIREYIRLEDLSRELFLSQTQCIRLFKKETGMTPNEYVISFRIMKSREYLSDNMPVSQVCELVGYEDESHFIRTFKKIMGITPRQYEMLKRR